MIKKHSVNKLNNFISGWYINNDSLCDNLVHYFEKNPNKFKGQVGSKGEVIKSEKDSTDLAIIDFQIPIIKEYLNHLYFVIKKYQKQYIYSNIGQGSFYNVCFNHSSHIYHIYYIVINTMRYLCGFGISYYSAISKIFFVFNGVYNNHVSLSSNF
jgi:hypothetical protein